MDRRPAAIAKRLRKNAARLLQHIEPAAPTYSPGADLKRGTARREDRFLRADAFDHDGAAGARLRHERDCSGNPRRPKPKASVKKPYDPVDHVHPRRKREWMRSHPAAISAEAPR